VQFPVLVGDGQRRMAPWESAARGGRFRARGTGRCASSAVRPGRGKKRAVIGGSHRGQPGRGGADGVRVLTGGAAWMSAADGRGAISARSTADWLGRDLVAGGPGPADRPRWLSGRRTGRAAGTGQALLALKLTADRSPDWRGNTPRARGGQAVAQAQPAGCGGKGGRPAIRPGWADRRRKGAGGGGGAGGGAKTFEGFPHPYSRGSASSGRSCLIIRGRALATRSSREPG